MAGEIPYQCQLTCPLNVLPAELIPEGLRKNCKGPRGQEGDEIYRFRVSEDSTVEAIREDALEIGEIACTNASVKLAFGLTELE